MEYVRSLIIRNANGFEIGLTCFGCYCCFALLSE